MNQDYLEWKHWEAAGFGQCSHQAGKYLSWHLRRAFPRIHAPLNVLELGFGNGQFLSFCRSQGFSVMGVEVNAHLVDRARAAGFTAVASIEETAGAAPFDLIAAFDVFEHLDLTQLRAFLDRLDTLLGDNGCLLVRVPNGDSPFGRRHQHGDLTHITSFGEFKFRQIAQKWNLSLVAMGESPWYIDEFERVSVKSLIRGLLKASIELVFGFVFYRTRVPLDSNTVVVLRKMAPELVKQ